jgi:hypothetical protein
MLADQESRGGAGVYRFTATSLRGAFDQGWSAADVRRWLERHSTTGVPQPLAYLVDDVARRHDSIRVGPAGSYVRLSDQAQAAALLAHPAAAALGLRAVAPGVLVASVDEHELLPLLQELGLAPALENGAGEVIGTPPTRRATGHIAKQQAIPSAAEVADALLAHERRQQVYAESAASPTKQAVGRSSVPRTLARSIE